VRRHSWFELRIASRRTPPHLNSVNWPEKAIPIENAYFFDSIGHSRRFDTTPLISDLRRGADIDRLIRQVSKVPNFSREPPFLLRGLSYMRELPPERADSPQELNWRRGWWRRLVNPKIAI
jgi:hypothetical protein